MVGDLKLQGMTSVVPEGRQVGEGRCAACLPLGNRSWNFESSSICPSSYSRPLYFSLTLYL